jgi:CubicO group peptidase (beta-lactamase class C family)
MSEQRHDMGTSVAPTWTLTRETVTSALSALESSARRVVGAGEVPGLAIAVVYRDEVLFAEGFGARLAGGDERVDADTVFQLASLSKPIASTVVAALVSDRAVGWDTRIVDIDPEFQLAEPYPTGHVTVRDLFAHRSGLPGNAGNDLEALGFTRDEIMRRLRYLKPSSSFRSAYAYSNFGITQGALAAAKAAGLSWEDAAEARLYRRLGMASSSSRHSDFLARTNRASLHVRYNGAWTALATRDPDGQSPAGGVSSTARDLAQWMRLELAKGRYAGEELIDEDAIAQTHAPHMDRGNHPVSGVPAFYGLGWNVEYRRYGTVWGHAGAFSQGARTVVSLVPSHQLGIVVLTNAFPTGVPEGISDVFLEKVMGGDTARDWIGEWNGVYASLFGPAIEAAKKTYAHQPADASPALPLSVYVGTYANAYLGTVSAVEADEALTLRLGPNGGQSFNLAHFDRDLFIYYPYAEMPDLAVAAIFAIGPGRKALHLTLDDLNDSGQGELARVMPVAR